MKEAFVKVRLKSGGPDMTIVDICRDNLIVCEWIDDNEVIQRETFDEACLEKIIPDKLKVLCINGYFELPVDFEGTEIEAIELWLEYKKRPDTIANRQDFTVKETAARLEEYGSIWNQFWHANQDGFKWSGNLDINTLIDGEWDD